MAKLNYFTGRNDDDKSKEALALALAQKEALPDLDDTQELFRVIDLLDLMESGVYKITW